MILTILLLIPVVLTWHGFCVEYTCDYIEDYDNKPVCAYQWSDEKIFVQPCPQGYTCKFDGKWLSPQEIKNPYKRAFCEPQQKVDPEHLKAPGD